MSNTVQWEMAQVLARPQFYRLWWPLALGLVAMYGPTFYDLGTGLWSTEGYAHGPIILLLALWLIARQWPAMWQATEGRPAMPMGWVPLVLALCLYVFGRAQDVLMFEIGSFILILASLLLILRGPKALALQWFPFFFMLFMIPLPGAVVGALTMPMKMAVSYVTELLLYWAGYPIARSGVTLQIGQYQLLVADACAGLQTLLTLEALGLFYLNVVKHTSPLRNVVLACLIIPISFTANVIRVIALTLITYYFGDAVGQGFLHGFAGMVLFISALLLIIGVDSLLQFGVKLHVNKQQTLPGASK
ncbi:MULTISPECIES: exosortase B [unclassified Duganella]|uniref:exosortase B n=1 Tax=unclassified Duganella TaxID=2636909 RepID=UPI000887B789|nr:MULTISPECIES: exosortase B [unclassified Duganella]SDH35925.1 exosortase B [Duganella sp. OV458]SDK52329.1 exosortase B [Duganella sp. OV510]